MGLYRIRANFFVWVGALMHIFIDKYLGGGWSAVALIRVLWIVGAFACGLVLDLLVCGIGADL